MSLSLVKKALIIAADDCDSLAAAARDSGFLSDAGQVSGRYVRRMLRREPMLRTF